MMQRDDVALLALAERCEQADDGALSADMRWLNVDILRALGWRSDDRDIIDPDGNFRLRAPDIVGSLDAAMTLVPEGWNWMAGNRDQPLARAYVNNGELAFVGAGMRRNPDRQWYEVVAATPAPALALCAAALRARAAAASTRATALSELAAADADLLGEG